MQANAPTQTILKGIPTSASDWSLYSDKSGVKVAALQIAQTLSDAIRANYTADIALDVQARDLARSAVFKAVDAVFSQYSDFGACDGEAFDVAARLINKAFPRKDSFNW
jgi:hypothetical protein